MNNNIKNFCTVKSLCDFGYSRFEAYEIIKLMKEEYKREGYFLSSENNKVPMSYAEKWASKRLATSLNVERGYANA